MHRRWELRGPTPGLSKGGWPPLVIWFFVVGGESILSTALQTNHYPASHGTSPDTPDVYQDLSVSIST